MMFRLTIASLIFLSASMYAAAPVYNATSDDSGGAPVVNGWQSGSTVTSSGTLDQRVARLEREMAGQNRLDLLRKIDELQQELQTLRGQLEVQQHNVSQLQQQQKLFYADLDARIIQLSGQKGQVQAVDVAQPAAVAGVTATQALGSDSTAPLSTSAGQESSLAPSPMGAGQDSALTTATTASGAATIAGGTTAAVAVGSGTSMTEQSAADQQVAYEQAYDLIKSKQYDAAIKAMQQYVKDYPNGQYAANAHYWLGELLLVRNDLDSARVEFQTVVDYYPQNPKVADSLLKLGYIEYDKQNWDAAQALLTRVTREFPNTPSARLAQSRLAQIQNQQRSEY